MLEHWTMNKTALDVGLKVVVMLALVACTPPPPTTPTPTLTPSPTPSLSADEARAVVKSYLQQLDLQSGSLGIVQNHLNPFDPSTGVRYPFGTDTIRRWDGPNRRFEITFNWGYGSYIFYFYETTRAVEFAGVR